MEEVLTMLSSEYLAGFFDGEGFVSINSGGRVQIGITQKNPEILCEIKNIFGGNIYLESRKPGVCSHWKITDKVGIKNFLSLILPFSVVKKKEIELGLRAVDLVREDNLGCNPLDSDNWSKRLDIREEMQRLRPKKTLRNLQSDEAIYRAEIKRKYEFKCTMCGTYLKNLSPIYQIIRDDKLICRKCNALMNIKEIKPLTREQIEDALSKTGNLPDACKILGVNR
jgi:hypothetical protein